MRLLNNDDVAKVLPIEAAIGALRQLFQPERAGTILSRPRTESWQLHPEPNCQYRCKTMEGGAAYLSAHVLRVVSSVDEEKREDGAHTIRRALPGGGWVGMLLVFDTITGELVGIMPDGYLQRTRVGALYAIAAERLSRPDAEEIGILGSGWQAGAQLAGLACVRKIRRVRVFSPNNQHCQAFAAEMSNLLGITVEATGDARAAISRADIVVLATNSTGPVFDASWVRPGQHVSSLRGRELDPQLFVTANRVIINVAELWRLDCAPGELQAQQRTSRRTTEQQHCQLVEAHDFFAGMGWRADANEITLFPDEASNFRLGAQFAAVACRVLAEARRIGLGRDLPRDWFVQSMRP